MAGLGRRTFAAGEVLTASNVMGYLQDQAVMNFAGTAARGTALGTAVSKGMVSTLNDSNTLEIFNGTSWQRVYAPAGLSGQIVQVQSVAKTDTWSASLSANTLSSITGLSVSITPKSTSNKILVIVNMHVANSGDSLSVSLKRASTYIGIGDAAGSRQQRTMTANAADSLASYRSDNLSMTFLDSPATTSSTTYSVEISTALAGVTRTLYLNRSQNDDNNTTVPRPVSTITVMEVAV